MNQKLWRYISGISRSTDSEGFNLKFNESDGKWYLVNKQLNNINRPSGENFIANDTKEEVERLIKDAWEMLKSKNLLK